MIQSGEMKGFLDAVISKILLRGHKLKNREKYIQHCQVCGDCFVIPGNNIAGNIYWVNEISYRLLDDMPACSKFKVMI